MQKINRPNGRTMLFIGLVLSLGCDDGSPSLTPDAVQSQAAAYRTRFDPPRLEPNPELGRLPEVNWTIEQEPPPPPPPPPEDPPPITLIIPEDPSEAPVGTIAAELSVTPQGRLSYGIPIVAPPGFRGMEPNISLTYTGTNRLGLAGRGFEITGLSRIHRCPGNRSFTWIDPAPLLGTRDDELCLDGQRLVLVSGTHGQVGATYRTEIDSFTKIVATGDCSYFFDAPNAPRMGYGGPLSGPCEFTATFKNGSQAWFGGPAARDCSGIDTTVQPAEPAGLPPRIEWPMVRMRDRSTNVMYVDWEPGLSAQDASFAGDSRMCLPSQIRYGANTQLARNADRRIRFEYTEPHDRARQVQFQAGIRRARFKYLSRIVTEIGPESNPRIIKTYELDLQQGPTDAPRLMSVTECAEDNSCLPPTRFEYEDGDWLDEIKIDSVNDIPPTRGVPDARAKIIVRGDFNGDGRPDFFTKDVTTLSGTIHLYESNMPTPHLFQWRETIFPNPITSWQATLGQFGFSFKRGGPSAGDVNGDGFDDLIFPFPGGYHLYFGSATGLATTPSETHNNWSFSSGIRKVTADFDGDAKVELLVFNNNFGWTLYEYTPVLPNNGFQPVTNGNLPTIDSVPDFDEPVAHDDMEVAFTAGDFNGDGRADLVTYRRAFLGYSPVPDPSEYNSTDEDDRNKYWQDESTYTYGYAYQILAANDAGGFDRFDAGVWPHASLGVIPGEFNGDGLTDLLLVARTGAILSFSTGKDMTLDTDLSANEYPFSPSAQLVRSGGAGGFPWTPTLPNITTYSNVYAGDFDGDGRSDVVTAWRPSDALDALAHKYDGVRVFSTVGASASQNIATLNWSATRSSLRPDEGRLIVGDLIGRGIDSVLYSKAYSPGVINSAARITVYNHPQDALKRIMNGLGQVTEIDYEALSQTFYDRGTTLSQPIRRIQLGQTVVDTVTIEEPQTGQSYTTSYDFDEGAFHRNGRGFLGFEKVRKKTGNTVEVITHRLEFPYTGLIESRETQLLDGSSYDWEGPTLRKTDYSYVNNYTAGQAQDIWVVEELTTDYHVANHYSTPTIGTQSNITREYDSYGNVLMEITDPDLSAPDDDVTVTYTYDNDVSQHILGVVTEKTTDFGGSHTLQESFEYDLQHNMTFHGTYDDFHGLYLGVRHTYDRLGNVTESIAPDGGRTVYTYGPNDMDVVITDANQLTTSKTFDPGFGTELTRVDTNGLTTTFLRDGFGRTTAIQGPSENGQGTVTLKQFERIGLSREDPNFGTVPNGYVLRTRTLEDWSNSQTSDMGIDEELYDTLDRPRRRSKIHQVEGVANVPVDLWVQADIHYSKDLPNQVESESRAFYSSYGNPIFTHYAYDAKGRPLTVYRPDNEVNQFVYDDVSRQVGRYEPGNATLMALDGRGNMVAKLGGNGGQTMYAYDNLSRLTQVVDPAGVTTLVGYDSLGRKAYVTHSDTGTTQLTYDAEGHLSGEIDPKGQTITRAYDGTDRTRERHFFDTNGILESSLLYTYDDPNASFGTGRLTSVVKTDGEGAALQHHQFGYDVLGRQSAITIESGGFSVAFGYAFSPSGEAVGMTYPDGSELRFNRRRGGLLASIDLDDTQSALSGFREITRFRAYDPEGRPQIEERANDTAVCQVYAPETGRLLRQNVAHFPGGIPSDACGHVTSTEDPGFARTDLLDVELEWQKEGRISDIIDRLDATRNQTFGYDAVGQLTSASAPGLYGNMSFAHDLAGNRVGVNGASQAFSGHQLTSNTDGLSITWDVNGNMTERWQNNTLMKSLMWTVDDRLASVTTPTGMTRYAYDFTGQRIFKDDTATGNKIWYFAREFEITEVSGGQRLATKLVPGPTGVVAQVTHPWNPTAQQTASATWHDVNATRTAHGGPLGWMMARGHAVAAQLVWVDTGAIALNLVRALVALILLFGGVQAVRRFFFGPSEDTGWRPAIATATLCAFVSTFGLGEGAAEAMTPSAHGPGVPQQSGLLFLYGDHVGSTSLVVSDSPSVSVVSRYHYRPFGALSATSTGSDEVRPKLHGQELDATADLYYANERYMDPDLGIFVSADTSIGAKPLEALSQHRYAFANNNPISYRDPSGRFALVSFIVGITVAAVVGGLIGGTQGKILTDPLNAFDNWSWKGAAIGAALGAGAAATGFALSAAGSAITIGGLSMKGALTSMWSTAVVRGTMAYAHGGDGAAIAKAMGIGAISGFIAGSGFFGMASTNEMGAWMAQQLSTLSDTALKLASDQEVSLKISLWIFSVKIDHRGKASFGVDYGFLAKKGFAFLSDLGKEQKWGKPLGNLAKNIGKNVKLTDSLANGEPSWFGLSGIVKKAATGELGFFESAADIAKAFVGYGASTAKKTPLVTDLLFMGELGVMGAKAGLEKGIEAGLCALDPKASGC